MCVIDDTTDASAALAAKNMTPEEALIEAQLRLASYCSDESQDGNQPADSTTKDVGGFWPRQLVARELEGTPFAALVLRVQGGEADIVYLDDGQTECSVPMSE